MSQHPQFFYPSISIPIPVLPGVHCMTRKFDLLPIIIAFSTTTLINQLRLEAHPHLSFTVIVNPNSGPGTSQYPDDQYSTELQKLNAYPNVETVGYVRTGYATRNITTVVSEVSTYAGWATKSSALAMHGIFFDESPHEYSADAVQYMRSINQSVKNATGLQGIKTVKSNSISKNP
jgi:hypothetical protein